VVSDRTVDSHVRHIRAKFAALGGEPIETVHGLGYRFADTRRPAPGQTP
jgi:two-component system OmpR family response regulator